MTYSTTGDSIPTADQDTGAGARRRRSVLADAADMWHFAHRAGIAEPLKALHRPRLARSLGAAVVDWMVIALAVVAASALGWVFVPVALLLIGNRQRALGNLLHDASHWGLDGDRRRSAVLSDLLFCSPLWISMTIYRDEHHRHHKYLGDPERDPDYIHDASRLSGGWLSVWLDQLLSWRMFRASLLGHLVRMDGGSLVRVATWWGVVIALITWIASSMDALNFVALWIAARVTVFHAVTVFREISDHVGLEPGSLIGFSRNHPFNSLLGELIHPHNNGYHLLHHLTPGIPFHAVPAAHRLLSRWPRYTSAEQCDSYFMGESSAVDSWVSRAS